MLCPPEGIISLTWDVENPNDPNLKGFEIYRARGRYDSTYSLIYSAPASERTYNDLTAQRGIEYYYYIVSVSDAAQNTGVGNTPAGELRSNRYLTQTYDPAFLRRQASENLSTVRIVPNPYNLSANLEKLQFAQDRLYFFGLPKECTIKIFTELGELVYTINHTDGSGDESWDSQTSSGQIVVSGLYIAVIETPSGERTIKKFVVIR